MMTATMAGMMSLSLRGKGDEVLVARPESYEAAIEEAKRIFHLSEIDVVFAVPSDEGGKLRFIDPSAWPCISGNPLAMQVHEKERSPTIQHLPTPALSEARGLFPAVQVTHESPLFVTTADGIRKSTPEPAAKAVRFQPPQALSPRPALDTKLRSAKSHHHLSRDHSPEHHRSGYHSLSSSISSLSSLDRTSPFSSATPSSRNSTAASSLFEVEESAASPPQASLELAFPDIHHRLKVKRRPSSDSLLTGPSALRQADEILEGLRTPRKPARAGPPLRAERTVRRSASSERIETPLVVAFTTLTAGTPLPPRPSAGFSTRRKGRDVGLSLLGVAPPPDPINLSAHTAPLSFDAALVSPISPFPNNNGFKMSRGSAMDAEERGFNEMMARRGGSVDLRFDLPRPPQESDRAGYKTLRKSKTMGQLRGEGTTASATSGERKPQLRGKASSPVVGGKTSRSWLGLGPRKGAATALP